MFFALRLTVGRGQAIVPIHGVGYYGCFSLITVTQQAPYGNYDYDPHSEDNSRNGKYHTEHNQDCYEYGFGQHVSCPNSGAFEHHAWHPSIR